MSGYTYRSEIEWIVRFGEASIYLYTAGLHFSCPRHISANQLEWNNCKLANWMCRTDATLMESCRTYVGCTGHRWTVPLISGLC